MPNPASDLSRRAMESPEHDFLVVGAGNAARCAALSAREDGALVVVVECVADKEPGGNRRFSVAG